MTNDKIRTYYSNARLFVKQNNPIEARKYVLAILNSALDTYKNAGTILLKVKTEIFMDKWIAVSRDLYNKGITDYVLECFGLKTESESQVINLPQSPKISDLPQPSKQLVSDDKIDFSGLVDEDKTQGWCAEVFEANKNSVVEVKAISGEFEGVGTGFIISENGYILTNDHVVFDEESGIYYPNLKMSLSGDKKKYKLEVLFSDKQTDIALCKFNPKKVGNFKSVKLIEDYSSLKQGADCLIIGNAFGMGLAPFTGIIRYTQNECGDMVYTAPSNPGDSGGPVFNRQGECIGVNKSKTVIINGSAADGYANATPIDSIKKLLNKWTKNNNIEI